jgi:O-antigen/teichoic acid export membrane protein
VNKILEKYRALSKQARAAFWFTGCSFLQKGISFITVPIFTRLMSTEEYGVYTLYTSWYQILIIFTSLYIYNGVYDNAMSKFDADRSRFTAAAQGLTITVTGIVFAVYLLTSGLWESALGLESKYIWLMFAEMLVAPSLYFWSGRARFEYQYQRLVLLTLAKSLINPLLGLALVYKAQDKAMARVVSIVLTELAFDVILMAYQFIKGRVFYDKKYWKYALTLALPLIPHYLAGMILNQGDRVMINRMVGKSEVALYGVAYSIGMLVQIFVGAINNAITPWMYECIKKKNMEEMRKRFKMILLLVAGLICGLTVLGPELVLVFGSSKYAEAVYVIPPVAASVYFIFLYGILAFPEFYYEKTKFLMFASVGAAALNLILNYIFINLYGYVAAGYTTLACYIVYSIGHYFVGKKILNQNIPDESVIDVKYTVAISLLLIVISIVGNLLVPYIALRYGMVAVMVLVAWMNRKKLLPLLKK